MLISLFFILTSSCTLKNKKQTNDSTDSIQNHELKQMVKTQIEARGITDIKVLTAMKKVLRHQFVPLHIRYLAYRDTPLPIGFDQTISQPYIVAFMTEAAHLKNDCRVLEIGTGSGYQAAVLAEICNEVYTIEIIKELGNRSKKLLTELGYHHVYVKIGDGYLGWPEKAPFDAILVTAAPEHIPQPLIKQLATGGHLIIPVGSTHQELMRLTKTKEGIKKESLLPVRFVPFTGPGIDKKSDDLPSTWDMTIPF